MPKTITTQPPNNKPVVNVTSPPAPAEVKHDDHSSPLPNQNPKTTTTTTTTPSHDQKPASTDSSKLSPPPLILAPPSQVPPITTEPITKPEPNQPSQISSGTPTSTTEALLPARNKKTAHQSSTTSDSSNSSSDDDSDDDDDHVEMGKKEKIEKDNVNGGGSEIVEKLMKKKNKLKEKISTDHKISSTTGGEGERMNMKSIMENYKNKIDGFIMEMKSKKNNSSNNNNNNNDINRSDLVVNMAVASLVVVALGVYVTWSFK